ncbi:MAG: hypothetical protein OXU28_04120, partial [Chloroflexota bacterium]|nr:hypothetical protein [Chloroflexota bacterium]
VIPATFIRHSGHLHSSFRPPSFVIPATFIRHSGESRNPTSAKSGQRSGGSHFPGFLLLQERRGEFLNVNTT